MNKVLNACCFEVFCASGSTCYDVESATVQILEGRDGILCVLIIAGANDNDVGTCGEGCINAFLNRLEAEVVDDLIASGGVSCKEDIMALDEAGIPAVVFGKAIYEGRINLTELITEVPKKD